MYPGFNFSFFELLYTNLISLEKGKYYYLRHIKSTNNHIIFACIYSRLKFLCSKCKKLETFWVGIWDKFCVVKMVKIRNVEKCVENVEKCVENVEK